MSQSAVVTIFSTSPSTRVVFLMCADKLEANFSKVRDKHSVPRVCYVRSRKEVLERKALAAHLLMEDISKSSQNDVELTNERLGHDR